MKAALWAVQVLLPLAFLAPGGLKLFAGEKYKAIALLQGTIEAQRSAGFPHLKL
jgi:hypothetical protein